MASATRGLGFREDGSTSLKDDSEHIDAVGYLISHGEEMDANGNTDDVYHILTLDGRDMRWTNAEFLALPEERIQSGERAGPAPSVVAATPSIIGTGPGYITDAEDMMFDMDEQDKLDAGILTAVKRDSINRSREFLNFNIDDEDRIIYLAKNYSLSCDDVRRALADGPNYDQKQCAIEVREARQSSAPRDYLSFEKG